MSPSKLYKPEPEVFRLSDVSCLLKAESRSYLIWNITETIKTSGHWLLTVLVWSEAADWHQVNIRHPPSLSGWSWVSEGARDNHDTGAGNFTTSYNYYEAVSRGNWQQLKPGGFLFNFGVKIWILGKILIFKTDIYYVGHQLHIT